MSNQDIYKKIKDRIVKLEYEPGVILNEQDLAKEFEVSRTPIRTVFKRLEDVGLLKIIPRYGAQVTQIDFHKMRYLFEMTRVLDPLATKLSVSNISKEEISELKDIIKKLKSLTDIRDYQDAISYDEDFHIIVTRNSNNPWLISELTRLHLHSERLWHYCNESFDDMSIFTRTFDLIVDAIERGSEEDAEKYAREHIDEFVEHIKGVIL